MNLDNVIGQEIAKMCLKSILKKPSNSPRMFIIAGPFGTGRKLLATSFINDMEKEYKIYDWSLIDSMEETDYIIVTELEKAPREEQVKLYNWFNSHNSKVFIITESTDNIIDQLKNLSLILRTSLLSKEELDHYIRRRINYLNIEVEEDIISLIVQRARGCPKYINRVLETYQVLNIEEFKEMIKSSREYYLCFLISCYRDNKEDVEKYIGDLRQIPLNSLKEDYESLILEILKVSTKVEKPKDKLIELLITELKNKALDLYYIMNDKVIYNSFNNDDLFQAAMYIIYLKINNRIR